MDQFGDYLEEKSDSGQLQGQIGKIIDDCTSAGADVEVTPFEIDNIVEEILKNLKLDDLKSARLVNSTFERNAVNILSALHKQDKLKSVCVGPDTLEILKKSQNRKIFRKLEFKCINVDNQTFLAIFEMIDLTLPTHIIFNTHDEKTRINFQLFIEFLEKISQNIVELKLELSNVEFVLEEQDQEVLLFDFPKLKTLEIEQKTDGSFEVLRGLLKKCHFLDNLKLKVHPKEVNIEDPFEERFEEAFDQVLPSLLTPELARNLKKFKVEGSNLSCFESLANLQMDLKSLTVIRVPAGPFTNIVVNGDFVNLPTDNEAFSSFLTSQSGSLEKLTIFFYFFENIVIDINDQPQLIIQNELILPRLENLKSLKLRYNSMYSANSVQGWQVKRINLPQILPNLTKIEITASDRWAMSFVADRPSSTVVELVLKNWSNGNMSDLVALFPNVKILKVYFGNYKENEGNLSFMEGWSERLEKIFLQFQDIFPQDCEFQGLDSLAKLQHLELDLNTRNNEEINPDFTSLCNIKKFPNLVIKNIKISDRILERLFKKFPKLDYTF